MARQPEVEPVLEEGEIASNEIYITFLNSTGRKVSLYRTNRRHLIDSQSFTLDVKTATDLVSLKNDCWRAYDYKTGARMWISNAYGYIPDLAEKYFHIDHPRTAVHAQVSRHLVRITPALDTLRGACMQILGRTLEAVADVDSLQLPELLKAELRKFISKRNCYLCYFFCGTGHCGSCPLPNHNLCSDLSKLCIKPGCS